jgi:hypothetical protein
MSYGPGVPNKIPVRQYTEVKKNVRPKDHDDVRPCDYKIHEKCKQTLQPHEGTPHYGFVEFVDGKEKITDEVKWACSNCESCFDEE